MPSRNGFLDEALDDDIPGAELQFLGFLSDLLVGAELVEIILGGGDFFVGNVALDGIALVTRHMIKRCARTGPVFRSAEEALDDVAHPVETGVMGNRVPSVEFVGNDRQSPVIGDGLADGARGVSLVGDDAESGAPAPSRRSGRT